MDAVQAQDSALALQTACVCHASLVINQYVTATAQDGFPVCDAGMKTNSGRKQAKCAGSKF